jgi:hypothetical protein
MSAPSKFPDPDKVADNDHGYRVAVEAYAIAAQHEDKLPPELMGALWNLCTAEYKRATGGLQ